MTQFMTHKWLNLNVSFEPHRGCQGQREPGGPKCPAVFINLATMDLLTSHNRTHHHSHKHRDGQFRVWERERERPKLGSNPLPVTVQTPYQPKWKRSCLSLHGYRGYN